MSAVSSGFYACHFAFWEFNTTRINCPSSVGWVTRSITTRSFSMGTETCTLSVSTCLSTAISPFTRLYLQLSALHTVWCFARLWFIPSTACSFVVVGILWFIPLDMFVRHCFLWCLANRPAKPAKPSNPIQPQSKIRTPLSVLLPNGYVTKTSITRIGKFSSFRGRQRRQSS